MATRQLLPFLLCAILAHCQGRRFFYNGRFWNGFLTNIDGKLLVGKQTFPDMWFNQTLDHFSKTGAPKIWQQRYFVNKQYYRPGGPAFLQIGGEGEANPIWMGVGAWTEYAKENNAICFMLEHRYYGKSHPTSDMSTENLQWLSSEQALADLAAFITAMTKEHNLQNAKWVTFGGSYPGSLSAWFRLKYPHLADMAVSSSAPLQALVDFSDYNVVAGQSIVAEGGLDCYTNVSVASTQIQQLLGHPTGVALISQLFKLCTVLDVKNKNDVANFFSSIAGNFDGIIQYNKDNRAFEGGTGTNITVSSLCKLMTAKGDPYKKYADVNSVMLEVSKQKCLDVSYTNLIKEIQETSWDSSAASGARQWTYQTCNEFGFYQSSDSKKQPFGNGFPVVFSVQQCTDIYGKNFNISRLNSGINATNAFYGSKNYNGTKVIFINGSIDPWHALGLTSPQFKDEILIVYIDGTAHCANMYPASPQDPPQLVYARSMVSQTLKLWLQS